MKIVELQIENYRGITVLKLEKAAKMNRIEGGNGKNKTAVLDGIRDTIVSAGIDKERVHLGEDGAHLFIRMDNGVEITRDMTPTANRLKVTIEGQPVSSPQKWLAEQIGPYNFDPSAFFLDDDKKRRSRILASIPFSLDQAALIEAVGDGPVPIDLKQFDYSKHGLEVLAAIAGAAYEKRHEQNLEVTRLAKALEQERLDIPATFNAERMAAFDFNGKLQELQDAQKVITAHEGKVKQLERMRQQADAQLKEIDSVKKQIAALQKKQSELEASLNTLKVEGKALADEVEGYQAPDIAAVQAEIAEYQQSQKLVVKLEAIEKHEKELESARQTHKTLDDFHKLMVNEVPRTMLTKVKLPMKGLEIRGDDIYVNGVHIKELSTSEKFLLGINLARSLAGKFKVILLDRWESIDPDNQELFRRETESDEFQYFATVVTRGDITIVPEVPASAPAETKETAKPGESGRLF